MLPCIHDSISPDIHEKTIRSRHTTGYLLLNLNSSNYSQKEKLNYHGSKSCWSGVCFVLYFGHLPDDMVPGSKF